MKKFTISILTTAALAFGASTTMTIDGFSSPESTITYGKNLFVSNVGKELKPTQKDGDGFISKLSKDGKVEALHFIDGLNAPKGMSIIDNILFVADIDTLRGFDLKTKKEVFNLVFDGVNFLNDITVKDKNKLFVSASDIGAIYEVDISKKSYEKLVDLETANGLYYEDGILYAVKLGSSVATMFDGKGTLYKIDLKDSNKITRLGNFEGLLDGIDKVGDKLYISDWGNAQNTGIVRVYDLKTKEESILKTQNFMASADIWIDKKTNKLYLPQMIGGKVSILDLK